MAAKYTLASGKTGSALAGAERASAQLSDGSLVYVRSDGSASAPAWGLYRTADRATEQLIATLTGFLASLTTAGAWSLAVDPSDNIYVAGPVTTTAPRVQRFTKGTGATWTAGALWDDGARGTLSDTRLVWCNTGSAGHLVIVYRNPSDLYARSFTANDVSTVNTYTWTQQGTQGALDISALAPGGLVIGVAKPGDQTNPGQDFDTLTISSAGALTRSQIAQLIAGFSTTANAGRVRLISLGTSWLLLGHGTTTGRWVAAQMTSSAQTGTSTASGAPTSMPLVADVDPRWDAYLDPQTTGRAWVAALSTPASSATSVQAIAATVSGSTITWSTAATTLDTLTATSSATTTNLVLRTTKVSKGRYVDFQASVQDAATPTYATYGDYLLYNTAPGAATPSSPVSNTSVDRTTATPLVWSFSDPDVGDTQSKADVRYRVPAVTSTWTTVTTAATTATTYSIPANTFTADQQVEWQVLTYDSAGVAATSWSASAFFTARNPTAAPVITSPVDAGTVNGANFPVQWTATAQDAYQVRRLANNAGSPADPTVPANVYSDTGAVQDAAARSRTVVYDVNGRVEHTQVRVQANGLWSSYASVRDTVNYTPPMTPTFTITPVTTKPAWAPYTDALDITVTQPAPTGGAPAAASHNVYIDDGTVEGLRRVAVINPGTTYRHGTPAHGRDFTGGRVVIETVATTGATARASS